MLLDLWSLIVIFSDLVDSTIHLVGGCSLPLSGHLVAFLLIGGVIIYYAWRSTDIPDLPSPPRPPYVIQIHASINAGSNTVNGVTNRQNLSDVRLLNSGPVIDTVLRSLPHRHHQTQHHQHQHGRHGTLFLGLLRRPQSRPLLPLPIPPTIRSRFQAPNLIVYHQVNVYHHTHGSQLPPSLSRNSNSAPTVSSSSNVNQQNVTTTTTTSETLNVSSNVSSNVVSPNISNRTVDNRTPEQTQNTSNITINPVVSLNSTRRSLSENNIADIESEESTVDVVEVEVDDVHVDDTTTTSQVGVDVNLNSSGVTIVGQNLSSSSTSASVQLLDGLNLNVNSNLVTMNSPNNNHGIHNTATTSSSSISPTDSSIKNVESNQEESKKTQNDDNTIGTSSTSSSSANNDSVDHNSTNSDGDVRVTLKFLNDTQMEVTTQLTEKIVDFKRRHFAMELNDNKIVRLIFNGRVLDNDGRTLQESGIFDQCVVHCLIVTPQASAQQQTAQGGRGSQNFQQIGRNLREGPDVGLFFVSVLGIILIFLWFICYQFGHQLFTQGAVVSLIVLTVVFMIGLVSLCLPIQT